MEQVNPTHPLLHTQLFLSIHVPFLPLQTLESTLVNPKQIGLAQFVPLYPSTQEQTSVPVQLPLPEQAFVSLLKTP